MSQEYTTAELVAALCEQRQRNEPKINIELSYYRHLYDTCGDLRYEEGQGPTLREVMQRARAIYTDCWVEPKMADDIIARMGGQHATS